MEKDDPRFTKLEIDLKKLEIAFDDLKKKVKKDYYALAVGIFINGVIIYVVIQYLESKL